MSTKRTCKQKTVASLADKASKQFAKDVSKARANKATTAEDAFKTLEKEVNASGQPTAETLYKIGRIVAVSVIRKCLDPQGKNGTATPTEYAKAKTVSPYLVQVRKDLLDALDNLDTIERTSKTAYKARYNTNGERVQEVADKAEEDALFTALSDTLGDGLDLVHDAILAILSEVDKSKARGDKSFNLSGTYTHKVLSKRVIIDETASQQPEWRDKETTPIQQIFNSVRRSIRSSQSARIECNAYSYLENKVSNPDGGDIETTFYRLPKYSAAATPTSDLYGRPTDYVYADTDFPTLYADFCKTAKLTVREIAVFRYRCSGLSQSVIADRLGVTTNSVKGCLNRIRDKAKELGYKPHI